MKPLIALALAAAALYAFLRRRPVASTPWADLERLSGFNERIRLGRAQLDAGQRVDVAPKMRAYCATCRTWHR